MNIIKNKTIYTASGVIQKGFLRFSETITHTGDMRDFIPQEDDLEIDLKGSIIIPGFIDVHSHGGYGYDCMDASAEEIARMVREMTVKEGITSYFCTTMTQSAEAIDSAMVNIRKAAELNPVIKGIHLEGPFISAAYKGAQKQEYIRKPDISLLARWQELSGGLIRVVTYAPEEASEEFEEWCASRRILLSAGHSRAAYRDIVRSGPAHVTHLFNAQTGLNHREPGVAGYGLLTDGVMAELIL